jgi:hypothetical protein
MLRSFIFGFCLLCSSASLGSAEQIVCPTQKQPGCDEILPKPPISCDRDSCNVAISASEGKNYCLWTCAAHFKGLTINGVPVDSLFDALSKSQKQ